MVIARASKMSKDEMKWRAEDDARILSEAEAIKKDPARLKKAQAAAARMLKEITDKAVGMRKIAGQKAVHSFRK